MRLPCAASGGVRACPLCTGTCGGLVEVFFRRQGPYLQCGAGEAAEGWWELHVQQHLHAYLAFAGGRLACVRGNS